MNGLSNQSNDANRYIAMLCTICEELNRESLVELLNFGLNEFLIELIESDYIEDSLM